MSDMDYVHGYDARENTRLQDQAATLVELLHSDTRFPAGDRVLEAGCGVGAQTLSLARNSPSARITSIEIVLAELVIGAQGGALTFDTTDAEETVILLDLPAPA